MPDAIKDLEAAIERAQRALEVLRSPITPEGWAQFRHCGDLPPEDMQAKFAKRHGCAWNRKEQRDIVAAYLRRDSFEEIARRHRRTEGGIRSELSRLLPDEVVERLVACVMAHRA